MQHFGHSARGDAALVLPGRTTCVDLAALLLLGDTALVVLCVMYQMDTCELNSREKQILCQLLLVAS